MTKTSAELIDEALDVLIRAQNGDRAAQDSILRALTPKAGQ